MKRIIVCALFICAAAASISGQIRLRVVAYNVGVFSKYSGDSTQDIANMMHELGADAIALCEPDSRTLRRLSEDWTVLSDPAPTYPSDDPRQCIDYILALNNRARYQVRQTAVLTEFECADVTKVSDHLPVFVDVMIN